METRTIRKSMGGNMLDEQYWKQIDIVTLTLIRNELVDVGNMLYDQKLPIDELIDKSLEKIDHCIDELNFYVEEPNKIERR